MSVRSGQSVTTEFVTTNYTTGAAANADSTPTGTLYVNGTADAASVTVTNQSTGLYKAAVTLPTLAVGDIVSIVISATVNSVAGKGKIWEDTKDVFAGAIPDVAAGGSGGLVIAGSNAATTFSGLTTGALSCTTVTISGAVALQSTLAITGTTTFTGAITASNGSNSISGVSLTSAGNAAVATSVLTTAMTEAYAADGVAPTLAQMQFMMWSFWSEVGISGTTKTAKKLDGSTTAMTFTLNSDTQPTTITRAT